jgi:hypothetical protein
MSLTVQDLIAPKGELEEFMFPDGGLESRVQAYLNEAIAKVSGLAAASQDGAARAWVYHRAYKAFSMALSAQPAEATLDSGKTEWKFSSEQIKTFKAQSDYWLEQYQGFFSDTPVGVSVGGMKDPTPTGTVFI